MCSSDLIGMIFVVSPRKLAEAGKILDKLKEPWYAIGAVIPTTKEARVLYE